MPNTLYPLTLHGCVEDLADGDDRGGLDVSCGALVVEVFATDLVHVARTDRIIIDQS